MSNELKPGLSSRVINMLAAEGITTKEQLEEMSEVGILKLPGFGQKSLNEINAFLCRENGWSRSHIEEAKRLLESFGYRVEKL